MQNVTEMLEAVASFQDDHVMTEAEAIALSSPPNSPEIEAKLLKSAGIEYADSVGTYTLHRRPCAPHGQGANGYGSKIATSIMLRFTGDTRMRRVYCTCYSNNGSNWIIYKGKRLYLRTHFQDEVQE